MVAVVRYGQNQDGANATAQHVLDWSPISTQSHRCFVPVPPYFNVHLRFCILFEENQPIDNFWGEIQAWICKTVAVFKSMLWNLDIWARIFANFAKQDRILQSPGSGIEHYCHVNLKFLQNTWISGRLSRCMLLILKSWISGLKSLQIFGRNLEYVTLD